MGPLSIKKNFTNRPDKNFASAVFNQNFRNVVGVSKMFDPELLSRTESHIGTILAELKPYCRTKAYRYIHEVIAIASGTYVCVIQSTAPIVTLILSKLRCIWKVVM